MNKKTCAWVAALLALSGCRIEVDVPPGGEVRTPFGTNDCAENTVCALDVVDTTFDETFRAVPREGFEFVGWRRDHRYFCGGSRKDCALNTAGFAGNDGLLSILESDQEFYLSPVFRKPRADFNGDGFDDLVVASIDEHGEDYRELFNILYGGPAGVAVDNQQRIQGSSLFDASGSLEGRLLITAEEPLFTEALEAADFDGDGFTDLAIGYPFASVAGVDRAGFVLVLYGSANGLLAERNQTWSQSGGNQDTDGDGKADVSLGDLRGGREENDMFGSTLTSGDFNDDGFADLAIGVPLEDIGDKSQAGGLNVLYGSAEGLGSANNQFWSQNGGRDDGGFIGDLIGAAENSDRFGSALVAADLTGDGIDDLVVSASWEGVNPQPDGTPFATEIFQAGAVSIIPGSRFGLVADGNLSLTQAALLRDSDGDGSADVNLGDPRGTVDAEIFGSALAAGDFNDDGHPDLAVGIPAESPGSGARGEAARSIGFVQIFFGGATGIQAGSLFVPPPPLLWANPASTRSTIAFGSALAAVDLDLDGCSELLARSQVANTNRTDPAPAGSFYWAIIPCVDGALDPRRTQWLVGGGSYDEQGQVVAPRLVDETSFANPAITSGDYDGDGFVEIATGGWHSSVTQTGAVRLYAGGTGGLRLDKFQTWRRDGGTTSDGKSLGEPSGDEVVLFGTSVR